MFEFLKKSKVSVTSLNLKWKGSVHSLGKVNAVGKTFEVTIPFQNKAQEDYSLFRTQKRPPIPIKNIMVKAPFKLVSTSPQLPVEVVENEKIVFKVRVETPDYAYSGPLEIELLSDSAADTVHLEISKMVVNANGVSKEVDNSASIIDLAKGQIFKKNIHLYGVVEIGKEVKRIEVSQPFLLVNSDPKCPFKVDNKTGFLIDLFIQAPQQNYGGPLEIKME